MTTFSQMVDKMVAETKRPDLTTEITSYLNQTIRELHTSPEKGAAVLFKDNWNEQQLTANADFGFSWTIPKVSTFQALGPVQYASLSYRNSGYDVADFPQPPGTNPYNPDPVWSKEMPVGRSTNREKWWHYRAGQYVFFYGYGGNGATINLSWYEFCPLLLYYPVATRPAQYDEVAGWTYATAFNDTPADQQLAQQLCSNWMLLRWPTVIEEGVRAKVYKRLSDDSRSKTAYSLYSILRQGLFTSETMVASGSWSG